MEINAAVFRKVHEPLTIELIEIDEPRGREVLVRTSATGVCHSDLHVVDGLGRFPLDRPMVLGHEGAGVVAAVGAEVTAVKPGDHIVACLSGFCGQCPQCLGGHPNLCTGGLVTRPDGATPRLSQKGRPLRQFIGISSYAEKMLLHENSLVKIDPELPLDRAALVGCGVLTGSGRRCAPRVSRRDKRWRSSVAAVSVFRSSRVRESVALARSSASTSSKRSARWRRMPGRHTLSTAPRTTR